MFELSEKQLNCVMRGYDLDCVCRNCFKHKQRKQYFATKRSQEKLELKKQNLEELTYQVAESRAKLLLIGEVATAYKKCLHETCSAAVERTETGIIRHGVIRGVYSYVAAETAIALMTLKNGFTGNIYVSLADIFHILSGHKTDAKLLNAITHVKDMCDMYEISPNELSKHIKHVSAKELGKSLFEKVDCKTAYEVRMNDVYSQQRHDIINDIE
jgi:hypothetical protein